MSIAYIKIEIEDDTMDSKDIKNISDYYKNLFTCKFKTN